MDCKPVIQRVYDHIENDAVDKAVMDCLHIARYLKDYLYVAVFQRELNPNKKELMRVLFNDASQLKEEVIRFYCDRSFKYWLDLHQFDYSIGANDDEDERNIFRIAAGELNSEIYECKKSIEDMTVPTGMTPYDTAYFTDKYDNLKVRYRLRIRACQTIKERLKSRCFNYANQIERQLKAQGKSQNFLHEVQNEVNNYFKAHSEDVYKKLHKAVSLVDAKDSESSSLLLTEVRRAINAAADYFYPPSDQKVKCADGTERDMGKEQYLNRLREYLQTTFPKSTSRDLLRAELGIFACRLNDIASKGVHANPKLSEAKQGLVCLYLFLFNICSRLEEKEGTKGTAEN